METTDCYHCGARVIGRPVLAHERSFCCTGCLSVFELLRAGGLEKFYEFNAKSGLKPEKNTTGKYTPLDVEEIFNDFISFQNDQLYIVTFFLPAIHCSSCVYLLENLQKLNRNILKSEANFTARTLKLTISKGTKLSEIAELLEAIGYKPELRKNPGKNNSYDKRLLLKLGVAGFAFGSVMLWTFPEYLGLDETFEPFRNFTSYLSLAAALPVFFYSASEYLKSAWIAIRTKQLNLDIPIALGIIVLFAKSSASVLQHNGPGYMDSFTGFVFFLLIGKWFQSKTYRNMSFENDPKAYFPLGVHRVDLKEGTEDIVLIDKLEKGDHLRMRNEDIIPCDSILISDKATIDTSFITGEAELISVFKGERIYAGSKLIGKEILLEVEAETSSSKFAEIWNKQETRNKSFIQNRENELSRYFLIIVAGVSLSAAVYWYFRNPSLILEIVTAIWVVACPCALALSFPFVYGNALRKYGRNGLYFKNTAEVKKMEAIEHLVFDKTGTLTTDRSEGVYYSGETLSSFEKGMIYEMTKQSAHPYSKSICHFIAPDITRTTELEEYHETPGQGLYGKAVSGTVVKLGNASFTNYEGSEDTGKTFIQVNGISKGYFYFQSKLREEIISTLKDLHQRYPITILSGDGERDRALFRDLPESIELIFHQNPTEKKKKIKEIQRYQRVAFIADGLNDSEALKSAYLGISVAENEYRFTPSSDAIIKSDRIIHLKDYFKFASYTRTTLRTCLNFSLIYNTVGISFAFMGYVTPLFAAVLMPLSSVTVVFISTAMIHLYKT
ncbi:MAG: heavy metal translocating P-type ATPase metal-binding domain-containing protein, partial [Brumimicrobium sp.]|nr:heavy metal translocating P-type ATPase metal-binding domain-containing protein [Brumimicrobium sp.]